MVGLFGIFKKSGGATEGNKETLNKMRYAMNPMPGNIVDVFVDENVALGRVSLGVLNRVPQPITDSNRRYHLFMDGQIFQRMYRYALDRWFRYRAQ